MTDAPRILVENELEFIKLIESLRLKGFTEHYAKNPVSGERVKITIEIKPKVVYLSSR